MCDPILVTPLKMRPHYSQPSRENATPSSRTSPLASYKEVLPPPPPLVHVYRDNLCHVSTGSLSSKYDIQNSTKYKDLYGKKKKKPIVSVTYENEREM